MLEKIFNCYLSKLCKGNKFFIENKIKVHKNIIKIEKKRDANCASLLKYFSIKLFIDNSDCAT